MTSLYQQQEKLRKINLEENNAKNKEIIVFLIEDQLKINWRPINQGWIKLQEININNYTIDKPKNKRET